MWKMQKWEIPKTTKEIERFPGFANYHRTFIKDYAKKSLPLTRFTDKKTYSWVPEQQDAFDSLILALTTTPVLALPNSTDPFVLDTDASDFVIGADLIQVQDDKERVIALYVSYILTPEQLRYCTTRKDLLSIVRFTKLFQHYLLGREFTIRTDHSNLTWPLNFKDTL